LLEFAGQAESLGVQELLLPILYVDIPGLSVESSDEAVALVAKTQYEDWRTFRLLEPSSREYRTAVNKLARRLLEIAKAVTEKQLDREVNADPEDDGVDGIIDIVEKIEKLLPDWLDAVLDEDVNEAQGEATWHELWPQVNRLRKAHAPASAVLAVQMRAAREILPLAERSQKDWRTYAARSIQLDPLISALVRLIAEHPESFALAMPVRAAIDEAIARIQVYEEKFSEPGAHSIQSHFEEMKHLGRLFQKCNAIFRDAGRARAEGDGIVERWDVELGRPPERPALKSVTGV
jgi:hypothetical protein